jgi:hypothetical protein
MRLALNYSNLTEDTRRRIWIYIFRYVFDNVIDYLDNLAKLKINRTEINNIYLNAEQFALFEGEQLLRWEYIKIAVKRKALKIIRLFYKIKPRPYR